VTSLQNDTTAPTNKELTTSVMYFWECYS